MSTLKYKIKERYSFGHSDPRGMFVGPGNVFEMMPNLGKGLDKADTHVLRDLWLFTFGDAPVSHGAILEHMETDDDIFWVGHELYFRQELELLTMRLPDRAEPFYGYALTKEK